MQYAELVTEYRPKAVKKSVPHVLMVEDDVTMELLWRHIIDEVNEDAVVKWVTTEEAAEQLIRQRIQVGRPFDLIVSDVFLSSHRTGVDLWRRYGNGTTPFILTSILTPQKLINMIGHNEPVPPYIQKPLVMDDCIETVRSLIEPEEVEA